MGGDIGGGGDCTTVYIVVELSKVIISQNSTIADSTDSTDV